MATALPQTVETAGTAAMLEWLRTRLTHGRPLLRCLTDVLLVDGATLEFLCEAATLFAYMHADARVSVASTERVYSRLLERYPRIHGRVAREAALDGGDAPETAHAAHAHGEAPDAAVSPRRTYDAVILPLLRRDRPCKQYSSASALVEACMRLLSPAGTLIVVQPDETGGAFQFRDHVRRGSGSYAGAAAGTLAGLGHTLARLGAGWFTGAEDTSEDSGSKRNGPRVTSADLRAALQRVEAGQAGSALSLPASSMNGAASLPALIHTERLDAAVDISDVIRYPDSPAAHAILSDLLDFDAEVFASREPAAYKQLIQSLRGISLYNVSTRRPPPPGPGGVYEATSLRVCVHTPFTVTLVVVNAPRPPRTPATALRKMAVPSGATTTHFITTIVHSGEAPDAARARGASASVSWSSMISQWLSPTSASSPAAATPPRARMDWMAVEVLLRHPLIVPPLPLLHGIPGRLRRERDGSLGFRPLPLQLARAAEPSGAEHSTHAPPSHTSSDVSFEVVDIRSDRASVVFDPWYPHGAAGGFVNRGLAAWHEQRSAWTARPAGYTHPPYPPEIDFDSLIDELTDMTNRVELPGPVRLPDIIDLFQEVWSPIEDDDSDSWSDA